MRNFIKKLFVFFNQNGHRSLLTQYSFSCLSFFYNQFTRNWATIESFNESVGTKFKFILLVADVKKNNKSQKASETLFFKYFYCCKK